MITFALSMDPGKYFSAITPTSATCPHDMVYVGNGYATTINP